MRSPNSSCDRCGKELPLPEVRVLWANLCRSCARSLLSTDPPATPPHRRGAVGLALGALGGALWPALGFAAAGFVLGSEVVLLGEPGRWRSAAGRWAFSAAALAAAAWRGGPAVGCVLLALASAVAGASLRSALLRLDRATAQDPVDDATGRHV